MPRARKPPDFYRADTMHSDDSVGLLFRRVLASLTQEVDRRLAPHDLTHAQWVPLYKLFRGECTTSAELARDLQLDPAAVTRALDRLEAKGLVRRTRSQADRRVVQLALTADGRRVAPIVPAALAEVFNAHLAGFSADEWATLIELLQRMLSNGEALREAAVGQRA
ncbi:MAG: MarR family transcriptional regulator [Betaproteobacteria bacterium]|nr:MarR family transcriptional regulator [Betaproteobacteria bacterium]MCC6246639.1 MarR family transcriptional regulator [Rubrivivax sp.]MCL4697099.1 MarR family transcriptional regulator [Burkholderiaceae bacterium]